MCNRFTLFTPARTLAERFGVRRLARVEPRYNIAPAQLVAIVRFSPGRRVREMAAVRWGLVPFWAGDPDVGRWLINARIETVDRKPAFRRALQERTCLIPTDGFYEWRREGPRSQAFLIRRRDGAPFAFAGVWDRWEPRPGEAVESCAIIVGLANDLVSRVHDRMPILVDPKDYDLWLDPMVGALDKISRFLRPYPSDPLELVPVGPHINDPLNEGPECIRALPSGR